MQKMTLESAYQQWQALQPLSQRDQERLSRKFSVDFNYNSNHIEGNTLTYGQTELLLLFGRDLEEMKASDVGLLMMKEEARLRDYPLTQTFIRQLHKTLQREDYEVYRNLPGGVTTSYTIHAGQYKTRPNSVITRYGDRFDYASPEETPILMKELVEWYNAAEKRKMYHPADLAILFHYRYIRIHPFEDGNGRIARLLHPCSPQLPDGRGALTEEAGISGSLASGRPESWANTQRWRHCHLRPDTALCRLFPPDDGR